MSQLNCSPHGGINTRFPSHKLVETKKGGIQHVQELLNLIDLDGRTNIFTGASRYNNTGVSGTGRWGKRIYYESGTDKKREQFAIIGNKMYKGDDLGALTQVTISQDLGLSFESAGYPLSTTVKVAQTVSTFLVDGKYFYKFSGNLAGDWERLPIKTDIDGNNIEPIAIAEYLDVTWVLVKNKNILLGSNNLNPEVFNGATTSVLIELPPGNGGYPQNLIVHPNGYLYVIHRDYIVPVTGSSPATFAVRPGDFIHGFGTDAPRSVIKVGDDIGFINSRDHEFYLLNDRSTPLSYPIKLGGRVNPFQVQSAVATLDSELNCIRISFWPTGGVRNSKEVIYSIAEQKWCGETDGRNISFYSQWDGENDDGEMITGRSDVGYLMKEDESINFDSNAIHFKWVSADYLISQDEDVQFETFYIDARPTGNHTIDFNYYVDSMNADPGVDNTNMQGDITVLGNIDISNQSIFTNRILPWIDRSKGRMIRFQIEGTVSNRILELYGVTANYNRDSKKYSKFISGR